MTDRIAVPLPAPETIESHEQNSRRNEDSTASTAEAFLRAQEGAHGLTRQFRISLNEVVRGAPSSVDLSREQNDFLDLERQLLEADQEAINLRLSSTGSGEPEGALQAHEETHVADDPESTLLIALDKLRDLEKIDRTHVKMTGTEYERLRDETRTEVLNAFQRLKLTGKPKKQPRSSEDISQRVVIPVEEIVRQTKIDMADVIVRKKMQIGEFEEYVKKHVQGVRINGVNVLMVDFEHDEQSEDTRFSSLFTQSPRTDLVVAEYFYPELVKNAGKMRLSEDEKHIKTAGLDSFEHDRISYAERLAEALKSAGKTVGVVDIANKPGYMIARSALEFWLPIIATRMLPSELEELKNPAHLAHFLYVLSFFGSRARNIGIFNRDEISKIDKFILDFEQARRMYAAKGIEQLTEEYSSKEKMGNGTTQIVGMYPKAHGIRIIDHMVHPSSALETRAKDMFYRLVGPGLDFSVRTWEYKDTLERLKRTGYKWGEPLTKSKENVPIPERVENGKRIHDDAHSTAGWRLVSDRPIRM